MAAKQPTIIDVMSDPNLLGSFFQDISWSAWKVFLKVIYTLPLTSFEAKAYARYTRRNRTPKGVSEGWVVAGRRAGKSLIASLVAIYVSCFKDYCQYLAMGERATVMLVAADRRQAGILLRYIQGFLDHTPLLSQMVERQTQDSIDLTNGVTIEVHTASFRSTRGYTIAAAICDEIAFWRNESYANPDSEILNALRPGMATIPGALLLCISSPYSRTGELWKAYRRHFGQDDSNVLVWQSSTRQMNPTVPKQLIRDALEEDAASASAEYLAEFRRDVETLITLEALEDVITPNRKELPPIPGVTYYGFVDPSGGSHDSMTLGITHREKKVVVLDAVRERKPSFSPEAVVKEFAQLLQSYGVSRVTGDRYAGQWCSQSFQKQAIQYLPSQKSKSDLYLNCLPLLNSGNLQLLDLPRLTHQLVNLERKTSRAGRESVDHGPGGHDDLANAAAGALVTAAENRKRKLTWGRDLDAQRNRLPSASYLPHFVHNVMLAEGGRK